MSELYIGLISGTSMDGIDAALVDLADGVVVKHALRHPYPAELLDELQQVVNAPTAITLPQLGRFDVLIGIEFANAVNLLLEQSNQASLAIKAVGSHGQNVFHSPDTQPAFTIQIGDPNTIAERCGIAVVADLRRRDVAAGGQGAPLAPALHNAVFRSNRENRAVLNLGGIANLTLLPRDPTGPVIGFDTGPASCLLDQWIGQERGLPFDQGGQWARQGTLNQTVLAALCADPYFARPAPKSTGREYFNLDWVADQLGATTQQAEDRQRCLLELTAKSVTDQLHCEMPNCQRLLVCGGGVRNDFLLERLQALVPKSVVESTADHGLDPDYVEATLFAWLAQQRLQQVAGNVASVTGADGPRVLGGIYPA